MSIFTPHICIFDSTYGALSIRCSLFRDYKYMKEISRPILSYPPPVGAVVAKLRLHRMGARKLLETFIVFPWVGVLAY